MNGQAIEVSSATVPRSRAAAAPAAFSSPASTAPSRTRGASSMLRPSHAIKATCVLTDTACMSSDP